jgi:hypothetical protein
MKTGWRRGHDKKGGGDTVKEQTESVLLVMIVEKEMLDERERSWWPALELRV